MADPFKSVSSGEALSIPAAAWNTLLRVARAEDTGASAGPATGRQATIVRVKNETGIALPRNSVLGLGNPIFTPYDSSEDAFLRESAFRGVIPDLETHKRRFAITLDPAPIDGVVRAYVAGVCAVKVELTDPTHEYANVYTAQTNRLLSSRHGHAQILWTEAEEGAYAYAYDDLGLMWAMVRLGAHCPCIAVGRASSDISPRNGTTYGTGTVELFRAVAGEQDGPVEVVEVLNPSETTMTGLNGIDLGAFCAVFWDMDGTAWVVPVECVAGA